jgi:hypothetical protein
LNRDPKARPSSAELLNHKWFLGGEDDPSHQGSGISSLTAGGAALSLTDENNTIVEYLENSIDK